MDTLDSMPTRIERRRLLGRMAADVDAGVNIVALAAPPGAGKTTALDQWAGARRAAGDLVLSVTARGDGTGDLWSPLLAAVRSTADPSEVPAVASTLSRVVNAPSGIPDVAGASVRNLPQPAWIVIDDVQNWSDATTIDQIGRLLAAARPELRLALGARYTPHGMLAKLVVEGSAKEYRVADLAFDRDETRALLAAEKVILTDDDLDLLLRRTDGWAAGLRLAALAIARDPDSSSFVRHFAGTERTVSDYLVTEVLSRLEPDLVEVLLDVSVADQVNLDLARLLTGRPDAGNRLEELVARNALVKTHPGDPEWYELHPLLRTYLRAECRRRDEARYLRHHAVATGWFERAGDVRSAIRHAVSAADVDRTELLVRTYCGRIAMSDGPVVMRDLLRSVPARLQSRPAVAGAAAMTALLDGNLPAARLDLAVVNTSDNVADATRRLALQALIDLAATRIDGSSRDDVDRATAALDLVAVDDPDLALLGRAMAAMSLAMIGEYADAAESAHAVAQIARRRRLDFLLFQTLSALCAVNSARSDFAAVDTFALEAIELAQHRGWDRHPRLAQFHGNLAFTAWQRGDDTAAADHARAAIEVADLEAEPASAAAALCIYDLAVVAPDGGLDLTAVGHLTAFNELWPMLPPATVALNACFELMASLRAQDMGLASAIVRKAEEVIPDLPDVQVLKAMKHVHQGRDTSARQDLERLPDGVPDCTSAWTSAVGWAVAAHLADAAGEPARAHDALMNALRLAEPGHLVRGLVDAAPSIHRILVHNRGRFGRHEAFVADLVEFATSRPSGHDGSGLALTDREIAVLRDLPSLLSLREIADAHVVSINTVKSHLKSVYRKLGVASRREAVDLARERGMI